MTTREDVIAEARTWVKTKWHHRACVKGAGVDCVFFLVGVYNAVGLTDIADEDIPYYPIDIMLHRSEETVIDVVLRYAHEVAEPKMGDIAVWKFGRIYSHAAIVIDWPHIIHAYRVTQMVMEDRADKGLLADREVKYFSFFEDEE
jgi:cell wall-associated NlpC family hydrolase